MFEQHEIRRKRGMVRGVDDNMYWSVGDYYIECLL